MRRRRGIIIIRRRRQRGKKKRSENRTKGKDPEEKKNIPRTRRLSFAFVHPLKT